MVQLHSLVCLLCQVYNFQSQCWHVFWRTHPVWFISQPSVFLRFWTQSIHWDPDCNEMLYLTLNLADVVCFSPNVKTRFKMVQNNQLSVMIFSLSMERIYTPYLYHQEFRKISYIIQRPIIPHLRSLMNFFIIQELKSFEIFWSLYRAKYCVTRTKINHNNSTGKRGVRLAHGFWSRVRLPHMDYTESCCQHL